MTKILKKCSVPGVARLERMSSFSLISFSIFGYSE